MVVSNNNGRVVISLAEAECLLSESIYSLAGYDLSGIYEDAEIIAFLELIHHANAAAKQAGGVGIYLTNTKFPAVRQHHLDAFRLANNGNPLDLSGAYLSESDLDGIHLNGVILDHANLNFASLKNTQLYGTRMHGTRLLHTVLDITSLDNSQMVAFTDSQSALHSNRLRVYA